MRLARSRTTGITRRPAKCKTQAAVHPGVFHWQTSCPDSDAGAKLKPVTRYSEARPKRFSSFLLVFNSLSILIPFLNCTAPRNATHVISLTVYRIPSTIFYIVFADCGRVSVDGSLWTIVMCVGAHCQNDMCGAHVRCTCADMHMCGYAHVRIGTCADMHMCVGAHVRCTCADMHMCGLAHVRRCTCADWRACGLARREGNKTGPRFVDKPPLCRHPRFVDTPAL